MGRAVAHAKLRDTGRAIADCSEAIRLMPSNSEPYRLRGEIYAAAGNKDHAEADFAMAEKLPSLGEERRKEAAKVPLQESAPIEASCH
jgi:Flp pilus assembly protein TadD